MPSDFFEHQAVLNRLRLPYQEFLHEVVCIERCFCQELTQNSKCLSAKTWLENASSSFDSQEGDIYYNYLVPLFEAILEGPLSMIDVSDQTLMESKPFSLCFAATHMKICGNLQIIKSGPSRHYTDMEKYQMAFKRSQSYGIQEKRKFVHQHYQIHGCFTKLWKFGHFYALNEYLMSQKEGYILKNWQNKVDSLLQKLKQICYQRKMNQIYGYYKALVPQIRSIITYAIQEEISSMTYGPCRVVVQSLWPDNWNTINNKVLNKYIESLSIDAEQQRWEREAQARQRLIDRINKPIKDSKGETKNPHAGLLKDLDDQALKREKDRIRKQEKKLEVQMQKSAANPLHNLSDDRPVKQVRKAQGQNERRQKERNAKVAEEAAKHHLPLYMRKMQRFVDRETMKYEIRSTIYSVDPFTEQLTQLRTLRQFHSFHYLDHLPPFARTKEYYIPYYSFQEERYTMKNSEGQREQVYYSYRVVDPEKGEMRYRRMQSQGPWIPAQKRQPVPLGQRMYHAAE